MNVNTAGYLKSIEYIKSVSVEDFEPDKISNTKSEFITENSKDIPDSLIAHAISNIDRPKIVVELSNLLADIDIASSVEASIYEFALIYASINSIEPTLINGIYDDRYTDIYMNLDQTSRLKNKTLSSLLVQKIIDPRIIAFLSPEQMHPENWAPVLDKIKFRENAENNMCTTDIYRCAKCGERKARITELQLRGADEPVTRFITCMVCYNTFLK